MSGLVFALQGMISVSETKKKSHGARSGEYGCVCGGGGGGVQNNYFFFLQKRRNYCGGMNVGIVT